MKKKGSDSLEGLFIALICCSISTLMFGSAGLSSMLFVACISRYNTDRNNAAFPFVLSNVLQAVTGPFAGYFAKRFGVRAVILSGSLLGFLGIGTCFFAEDITIVTVMWGIVFGTGFGLSTLLLPAIVNDYFIKHRSIALGMCYLGSPIGFLVYPPIFEVLLERYGLSGTFLFLSAINMHCIPLSMLLKRPKFKPEEENSPLNHEEKRDSYSSTDSRSPDQIKRVESEKYPETNGSFRRSSIEILWDQNLSSEALRDDNKQYTLFLNKKHLDTYHSNAEISQSYRSIDANYYENASKDLERAKSDIMSYQEYSLVDEKSQPKITYSKLHNGKLLHKPNLQNYEEISTIYFGMSQGSSTPFSCHRDSHNPPNRQNIGGLSKLEGDLHCYYNESYVESNHTSLSEIPTLVKYREIDGHSNYQEDNSTGEVKSVIKPPEVMQTTDSLLHMYLNPVFILICITNGIGSLHFSALTTVIIDFSRDHQIDVSYEKFIMMSISLMGALGMLGFSWVTDGGFMSRPRFASLTQLIGCLCTAVLPSTSGFGTLMVPLSVWCACQASFIPQIPAIIAEHFKEDVQTVAVSACNVLSGPMYLIIPPLIGYFRDDKGSYDNIFFLLGSLSFVNSIAVFMVPYLARWKAKSSQKS